MLHLLQIKANQFHADLLAGTPSLEALAPGDHVGDPALEGGRQPASTPLSIVGAWLSVSGLPPPARTACRSPPFQGLFDLLSTMHELRRKDHFACGIIDKSHACRFAAWIQF
jgi:hypothetical protein